MDAYVKELIKVHYFSIGKSCACCCVDPHRSVMSPLLTCSSQKISHLCSKFSTIQVLRPLSHLEKSVPYPRVKGDIVFHDSDGRKAVGIAVDGIGEYVCFVLCRGASAYKLHQANVFGMLAHPYIAHTVAVDARMAKAAL